MYSSSNSWCNGDKGVYKIYTTRSSNIKGHVDGYDTTHDWKRDDGMYCWTTFGREDRVLGTQFWWGINLYRSADLLGPCRLLVQHGHPSIGPIGLQTYPREPTRVATYKGFNEIGPVYFNLDFPCLRWLEHATYDQHIICGLDILCVTDHVAFSCTPLVSNSADLGLVWSMLTFQSPTLIPKSHPSLLPRNVLTHNIKVSITRLYASRYLNLKVLLGCALRIPRQLYLIFLS